MALAAAGAVLAAAGTAVGLWPDGRRLLIARAWCVITPHRIRTACGRAWIQTRNGKIPVVVYTAPQPFGERVVLWCRAGLSAENLASARELLIAACWAADIRITRSGRAPQVRAACSSEVGGQ